MKPAAPQLEASMKKFVVALSLLLVFLLVGAKPKPVDPGLPAYEINVMVVPLADSPIQLLPHQWRNGFRCSATIADYATGALRAHLETIVQPGRRGTDVKQVDGLTVMFGVQIDESREAAKTEVVLRRGDELLLRQRSTTRFMSGLLSPRSR